MNARFSTTLLATAFVTTGLCTAAEGAESVAPGINDRYGTEEGRRMATQVFEQDTREMYQKSGEVVRHMKVQAGDVVCEIGAGTGYFTPYLAKAVGPTGKVYAEDPQREFVETLASKVRAQKLSNVVPVVGTYVDTNLPDAACDVAFVLDAYHHFEWPEPMLDAMAKDLKQSGRLVIVDWYRKQNPVFEQWKIDPKKHLRLDRDEVIKEIEAHGWQHTETQSFLDYQYFLVFKPRK